MLKKLLNLSKKNKAVIQNINTDYATKTRLHSFGLIKGVEISFVKNSPFGSPRIYKCFNTLIAIRNNIAQQIEIKIKNES